MAGFNKLSPAQQTKVRDKLVENMLDARDAFIAANPDYADIELNADDVRVVVALAAKNGNVETLQRDGELMANKDIAKLRIDYVRDGRSTETIDLLTVKTEANIPAEKKFQMTPWLPAKRIKVDGSVWKAGFQNPFKDFNEKTNSFVGADLNFESTFQVLRAKGLFQLMTEAEIKEFAKKTEPTFELYFQLFL